MEKTPSENLQELVKKILDGTVELPLRQLPEDEIQKLDVMLFNLEITHNIAKFDQMKEEFLDYIKNKLAEGYDITKYWVAYYDRWIKP